MWYSNGNFRKEGFFMKRIFAFFLVLCLGLSLAGCKPLDYTKASKYYKNGLFAQAAELFASLEGYADSAAMAQISRQKADYEAAANHTAAGEYRQAMELYYGLELYMDSPIRAIESQYALGLSLIEEGQYEEAIRLLQGLGTYLDSTQQVRRAIMLWLRETLTATGGVTMPLDEDGQERLLLATDGGEKVFLIYTRQSLLLGLPNESRFALTLHPLTQTATYEASNLSTATDTIQETASGTVDPVVFNAAQGLGTLSFTQTVTAPDGTATVSNDTGDAIILHALLAEASGIIAENFAAILALTGTTVTPQDLGFLSLG